MAIGALLLFLANFVAIVFASYVVFAGVGFRPFGVINGRFHLPRGFLLSAMLLLLVAVPLVGLMVTTATDARENEIIRADTN